MNVLLVGFGSIGKRHFEILSGMNLIKNIHLVTKQNIEGEVCFSSLSSVECIDDYDYYVLCSETALHYEQLRYLCSKVKGKKILVEKPLYHQENQPFKVSNKVYTAYNLRFHPMLVKLKALIALEDIYYASIYCGQYLPTWRPNRRYQDTYSADLGKGGGALRDLSHEIDYMIWLFGKVESVQSINTKRSDLQINSDDIYTAIGVTDRKTIVNLTVDYISKRAIRRLIVHAKNVTIEVDMILNQMVMSYKSGEVATVDSEAVERDHTYLKMHEAIISGEGEGVCSFEEGLQVVSLISAADFKEI